MAKSLCHLLMKVNHVIGANSSNIISNMSFNANRENRILAKISKFTVFVNLFQLLFVLCVSLLLYCLVCSLEPCDHLLGKGSLVLDVFLCSCHIPNWYSGSGSLCERSTLM